VGSTPTPSASPSAGSATTAPTPTAQPTPSPQPNYPPIPPLPDLPDNAYQLLLALSTTIDTTSTSFRTSSGKLGTTHTTTNTAVGGIVANSRGATTNGLGTLWQYTQKDFTNATTPLNAMTASNALGGSPNQLQAVLDQHRSDFLNGIPAVEQLRHLVATNFASSPTVEVVQGLVNLSQALVQAMGNVNMALWLMINAVSNTQQGIAYACATGLTPSQPVPLFTQHAFAMEGNGGSGSSDANAINTINSLTEPDIAELLIMEAGIRGVSLDDIAALLQGGVDSDQVYEWLNNNTLNLDSITTLISKGNANEAQINAWINRGVNIDTVASMVNSGVDLDNAVQLTRAGIDSASVSPLIKEGVSPTTILTMLKSPGVTSANVQSVIEDNITNLINDSNPSLPLSRTNAIKMLNGPNGTYPQVAGSGGAGADINFIDPKTGNIVLGREEKSVTTAGGMTSEIRSLPAQLAGYSGAKEVVFQVPAQANAQSWVQGFIREKSSASLAQYKGITLTFVDPQGNVLWQGPLTK
jgi:hypothetical protein